MLPESHTAILERRIPVADRIETEPYEVSWARELIAFLYLTVPLKAELALKSYISADGMRWIEDRNITLKIGEKGTALKLQHFGGWIKFTISTDRSGTFNSEMDLYVHVKS